MARRGLVIVNAYILTPSLAHFKQRMEEELSRFDVVCDTKTGAEILAFVDSDGTLRHAPLEYDFVLYLDKDRYLASMLEMVGLRLFNSAAAIEACDDKMTTHLLLANQGIHMPKTIPGPLCYVEENNDVFIRSLMAVLSFPMVVKENYGSQGQGVRLIHNEKELIAVEDELKTKARIYQEFIASSKGFDDRLIVIDGHYFCGYRRRSQNGDFRSNIAQGGAGEAHVMSEKEIQVAEKAARLLGLDYCGIDLLDSGDPESPILCEVNSNAFIKGAEAVTGKNVAEAYAKHIVRIIYSK